MGHPEFRVDEAALGWDPAEVTVPEVPAVEAGSDPLSTMISAVMPTVATDVTTKVAATRAREELFAANLSRAKSAYQGTDGAGEQQISSAASGLSDSASPAAASGANPAASASAAGDGGFGQLSQLMGMAMQIGQQAVQAPMQAMGMAGQIPQTVMQGVQGLTQQAGQGSEKGGPGADGAASQSGAGRPGSTEGQPEAADEKPDEYTDEKSEAKKDDSTAEARSDSAQRAPVGEPQQASPSRVLPEHRRPTDTPPEVAL
ncbi:hypothetical protein H7J87_26780 [Mycolicibacterium wolinskyi]|nr:MULTISPECIES: hypothetical protein [Mycolicibacterium]MCV7288939.1 hypothetical protein [Mycolicibacterium wolinskyi]MCV7296976.1 hypothetical protein [Mycolicibacterium goodii]